MLSGTLLRREARRNLFLMVVIAGVLTMYTAVITTMYDPELGESLEMMMESMPQLFAAFGMNDPGATLAEFLANYLYGFLLILLPLVLIVLLVNRLLVQYLDRGTMAWLLATPTPRWKIALTQAKLLCWAVTLQVAYVTGLGILLGALLFPGELDAGRFLMVNAGLWAMLYLLGSVCFAGACFVRDSRLGLGAGGGLCVLFVLLQMLAQTGEKWEALQYLTPLTLFDAKGLAAGSGDLWPALWLFLAGTALFLAGIAVFIRRDLSL